MVTETTVAAVEPLEVMANPEIEAVLFVGGVSVAEAVDAATEPDDALNGTAPSGKWGNVDMVLYFDFILGRILPVRGKYMLPESFMQAVPYPLPRCIPFY